MIKALLLAIALMTNIQTADVVETYDNTMIVETQDGNLWDYEFDGMTEREMYAEKVLLFNDNIFIIK